ncbi:hypothetical protein SLEP1_g36335 [Rubroshorea leprosula]|uniref:Uncharacterized protein n=1 Tax=Rubroshorea leprosula TaxID=152421 RepID=A0AAV5KR41_9ROSI|nr:hypothetical protein SLEP1_g36335 [Rubroshorea leprosula]
MSGNPTGSSRRRSSSSGSQEQHNFNHPQLFTDSTVAPNIQQTIDPLMNYNFSPDHENEDPSSSTGKKGWSRNFKGIRPPENRESRGAKNRSSGERVTHTTRSVSFGIHEMRMTESRGGVQPPHQQKFKEMHTFRKKAGKDQEPSWINEKQSIDIHGSDASSWPRMDNEAWVKVVRGCSSNFMIGIGSQVNLEMAKDHEELERQRQQIALMQQQLANMTEAQNNMSQTIAQSVAAALAAHGISPQAGHHPVAPPQPSHGPGSGLCMNSAFTYSTDSTQTSPMVPEYQQQQQFPPQDDDAYHPTFDPDYQGP